MQHDDEDDRIHRWRTMGSPRDTRAWGYDALADTDARGVRQDVRQFGGDRGDDRHLAQGEGGGGDWEASAYASGQRRGPGLAGAPYRPDPSFDPAHWPASQSPIQRFGDPQPSAGGSDRHPEGPGQAPGDSYGGWPGAGSAQGRWAEQAGPVDVPPQPTGGRGPRGWRRSDAAVHDDVCVRLSRAERLDTADVSVAVRGGHVTLEGTVADRPMKHAIEDLVDRVPGVADIDNRIKVMRGPDQGTSRDGPPAPHASVPQDSPTARDARRGRFSESLPGGSGKAG